jgi:ribosomal RNA-processing protein 17
MFGPRKAVRPSKSIFSQTSLPANSPVVIPNAFPAQVFEFPTFGRDDSIFAQPKFRGPNKKEQDKKRKKKQIKSVDFDTDARKEFLTGFHKRKVERTNLRREKAKARDKLERKEERKERRFGKEKAAEAVRDKIEKVRDVVAGKLSVEELAEEDGEEEEETVVPFRKGRKAYQAEPFLFNEKNDEDEEPKERKPKKKKDKRPETTVFTNEHSVTTVNIIENMDLDDFLDANETPSVPIKAPVKPKISTDAPKPKKTEVSKPKRTKANPHRQNGKRDSKPLKKRGKGKEGAPGKHGGNKHRGKKGGGRPRE